MTMQRLIVVTLAMLGSTSGWAASEDIVIGQTTDLSSVAGEQMQDFNAGVMAYLDAVNAKGGIGGRKIRLLTKDDGFTAARASSNAEELVANSDVVALFGTRGTDQTEAVIKVAERAKVPLIAPVTGADSVRESAWVFPVRASYRTEMEGFLKHFSLAPTTVAVLVQDDKFGNPLFAHLQKRVKEEGAYKTINLVGGVKFDRKATNLSPQVDQILAMKPQAVIALCNPTSCGNFLTTLYKATQSSRATRPSVAQTSISDMKAQYKTLGGEAMVGNPFGQVMPDPRKLQIAMSREFSAAAANRNLRVNYRSYEGYFSAAVLVKALRDAKSISRQGLKEAFEAMGNVNLGGVPLEYAPGRHNGSSFFDLVSIDSLGRTLQ
jgi:ABC-type branched-subunit amino acid transport system substrate-binding protein